MSSAAWGKTFISCRGARRARKPIIRSDCALIYILASLTVHHVGAQPLARYIEWLGAPQSVHVVTGFGRVVGTVTFEILDIEHFSQVSPKA